MASPTRRTHPLLGPRALNRATLARQLLLHRGPDGRMSAEAAVGHLVGLQAQNVRPPYYALAARLHAFRPQELSALMESREAARMVTLRSTIHTHTAADCLALRPFAQPGGPDRELRMFLKRLDGVDLDRLTAVARELLTDRPRPVGELRQALLAHWPEADPLALTTAARCLLPLVQATPRGLWGASGQVVLVPAEQWFGRPPAPAPAPETVVRRYLAAFGPASVKDMQTWSGLTGLRAALERLRPELLTFQDENGAELFDLPDAPRPDPAAPAPPRFLAEYDNLLLSHADRSRVVPEEFRRRTWKGNQPSSVFLTDGLVAGIWKLAESEHTATLTVQPFVRLDRAQRTELAEEGERLLTTMTGASARDVRFGVVADP
ncbi:winged helix DNA-binding domain-containing protein [Streptomyces sp. FIT100]|uniref:winged helix DNA-binding domain-containing protein n=1 Tax=Streptomyces sp. FIT100 TaxID=2837956 RepID=UPI0021C6528C|nr:winged helix DNA-binding domain-containing protein [Streptomyces sp. FIT100]UUN30080.1 winged helix DNA-binding domain-containing protein [Streptomyces sp. FIT100]